MKKIGGYFELDPGGGDTPNMTISHFGAGRMDVQVISRFLRESAAAYPAEVGDPDLAAWPEKLAAYADVFGVVRADGSLSAALFAYLNDTATHVGYVTFVCSLPESEKGTAYRLHNEFLRAAGNCGMTKARLEVVKTNAHALSFYKRLGYVVIADHDDRNRWLMEMPVERSMS